MTNDDTVDAPPPYDLRPSGVVYITVDGQQQAVRRPLLGEFRRFREAHHEAAMKVEEAGARMREELVDINDTLNLYRARIMGDTARAQRLHALRALGEDIDPARSAERARLEAAEQAGPVTDDEKAAHAALERRTQAILSELDDASLEAWAGWTVDTLGALGVTLDSDTIDPALASVEWTLALLDHWRNVTPRRGR